MGFLSGVVSDLALVGGTWIVLLVGGVSTEVGGTTITRVLVVGMTTTTLVVLVADGFCGVLEGVVDVSTFVLGVAVLEVMLLVGGVSTIELLEAEVEVVLGVTISDFELVVLVLFISGLDVDDSCELVDGLDTLATEVVELVLAKSLVVDVVCSTTTLEAA